MPAPTFTISQTIPTCSDSGGTVIDETNLDSGNLEVHADCCRYFGSTVTIPGVGIVGSPATNRTLYYQGTIDTCTKTGTGAKTFSSDSFRLSCSGNGAAFTASHTGSGTVSGATFTGTGTGTASGGRSGLYTITISGTLSSPSTGTFTGTVSGSLGGTLAGTITAGVVSVTYTLTDGLGGSATGGGTFTPGGGGTTFTFTGSISGTNAPPFNVYWSVVWTNCSTGGIVAQLLAEDDDSVLVEYANANYCLKSGRVTILNRRSVACAHPCMDYGKTQFQSQNYHPPVICFIASTAMRTCNGSLRDKTYTGTIGTAGHEVTDPMTGLTATNSPSPNLISITGGGSDTPADFAITGSMTWSGNFTTGVTLSFTFTSAGDWSASASVKPCNDLSPTVSVASTGIQWGGVFLTNPGGTVTITGGTGGVPLTADMLSPNRPTSVVMLFQAASTTGFTFPHDYCGGALTGSFVGLIRITGTVTTAGGTVNIDFTSDSTTSVPISVTQSGDAYP